MPDSPDPWTTTRCPQHPDTELYPGEGCTHCATHNDWTNLTSPGGGSKVQEPATRPHPQPSVFSPGGFPDAESSPVEFVVAVCDWRAERARAAMARGGTWYEALDGYDEPAVWIGDARDDAFAVAVVGRMDMRLRLRDSVWPFVAGELNPRAVLADVALWRDLARRWEELSRITQRLVVAAAKAYAGGAA